MRLPIPHAATLLALSVLGWGCSEMSLEASGADVGVDTGVVASPGLTDDSDTDAGTAPPAEQVFPIYWSLDGELAVQADSVDVDASALVITTWDADIQAVCAYDVPIDFAEAAPIPTDDVGLVGWFDVDLGAATTADDGCPDWQARPVSLGFGAYDARLDPALDAHGWEQAEPYGLYLQELDGPLYVVGVAGTRDQFVGDVGLQSTGPIDDGLYELHTVVLLDLLD